MNSIIKYSFLTLVFFTNTVVPQEFAAQAIPFKQAWTESALQTLNDEELTLLANFLYFDFISSMYDTQIRAQLNSLRKTLPVIQACTENYLESPISLEEFAAVTLQAKALLPLQRSAFKTWQNCSLAIDESSNETFLEIINQLADYGKAMIHTEINESDAALINVYQEMHKSVLSFQKQLHITQRLFQAMADTENLFGNPEESKKVAELSAIFSITNSLLESDADLYDKISAVKEVGVTLLKLNTVLFAECYQSLYERLIVQKPYTLIIQFDQNGKLPLEEQVQSLPSIHEFFQ